MSHLSGGMGGCYSFRLGGLRVLGQRIGVSTLISLSIYMRIKQDFNTPLQDRILLLPGE